jgi:phosphoribosyl 1,2-cyclic phosphate phosphodiesterase
MNRVIILGSGSAPGVPSLASGWGDCNPNNPKNRRRRTSVYVEIEGVKFLIDTSPDIHWQLLDNNIRHIDAVLYTHSHADHLHGIDDLRDLNRISKQSIEVYSNFDTIEVIKNRFPYLVTDKFNPCKASLSLNVVEFTKPFYVKGVKIVPIKLSGHPVTTNGYIFNDNELVYIADCLQIEDTSLRLIEKNPKLMVMPLTSIKSKWKKHYHMGLENLLEYVRIINPDRTIINHMAVESDYATVYSQCPNGVEPAFDTMEYTW